MICLVCEPTYLRIEQPINSFQVAALDDPPDRDLALEQHAELVSTLAGAGLDVRRLRPVPEAPYQVFTRDVVVGGLGDPILATPREPLREAEIGVARRMLEEAGIHAVDSEGGCLEGGDVVVSGSDLFVGVGDRTETGAAAWLRERCGGARRVHVLEMKPGFLHLDMVFNVLGPESCVWFPGAFGADARGRIRERFPEALEIDLAEQLSRSANYLPVGETAVIASTTMAPAVQSAIRASGRELHLVDVGEIQKAGGSVRCATCLI